jgi:hypothetical protein
VWVGAFPKGKEELVRVKRGNEARGENQESTKSEKNKESEENKEILKKLNYQEKGN